jgi:hypothetical protein
LLCVLFLDPAAVWAGAWTPQPGAGTTISNIALTRDNARGSGQAIELYSELGIGPDLAFVVAPSMAINGTVASNDEVLVAIRKRLIEAKGWAISSQFGYFEGPGLEDDKRGTGFESRIALGRGFNQGGWVDLESALRTCGETQGMRWEATIGHPLGTGIAILKGFGEDSGCAKPRARFQASYVFPLSSTLGIELGWRETFESKDDWKERAVVIGLWRSF